MDCLLEAFEEVDMLKEELITHGYSSLGDSTPYNRDAAVDALADICEEREVSGKSILWWEKEGEEENVFLVNPIALSILLDEYDYTRRLLDLGYHAERRMIYGYNTKKKRYDQYSDEVKLECHELWITQIILAKEIPVDILERILDELDRKGKCFELLRDYFNNSIFEKEVGSNEKILPMNGLEYMCEHFPKALKGFIEKSNAGYMQIMRVMETKKRHKLLELLVRCCKGNSEDLRKLFSVLRPSCYYDTYSNGKGEVEYWINHLDMFAGACKGDTECEKVYFEMLLVFLYEVMDHKCSVGSKKKKEEYFSTLKTALVENIPIGYDFTEYLYFIRAINFGEWKTYAKIWTRILKMPPTIGRGEDIIWSFVDKMVSILTDDDYWDCDEDVNNSINLRLLEFVEFLEEIEIVDGEIEDEEAYKKRFIDFVCQLMKIESEELVLSCMRNHLIPQNMISVCIECALKFEKLRLVPVMIMMNQKKEEG